MGRRVFIIEAFNNLEKVFKRETPIQTNDTSPLFSFPFPDILDDTPCVTVADFRQTMVDLAFPAPEEGIGVQV